MTLAVNLTVNAWRPSSYKKRIEEGPILGRDIILGSLGGKM